MLWRFHSSLRFKSNIDRSLQAFRKVIDHRVRKIAFRPPHISLPPMLPNTFIKAYITLLSFTLFCFADTLLFSKLRVCSNPVLHESIGAIFPTAFPHILSLCHILVIVAVFQTYFYYFICNGDLWLVIFYVTVIIVLGYYEPHSYKTTNLVDKCCLYSVKLFGLSSSFHFFSSPEHPYSLRHQVLKLGQLITLQWLPGVQVKGRVACLSILIKK